MSARDYSSASAMGAIYRAVAEAKGGSHAAGLLAVAKAARGEALEEALVVVDEHEGRHLAYGKIEALLVKARGS